MRDAIAYFVGTLVVCGIIAAVGLGLYFHPVITSAVATVAVLVLSVVVLGYYVFLKMVDANIVWTRVEKGWRRIILRWGDYHRIIGPGLRLIGIPGMHTLYKRQMTFFKSVTDEDGTPRAKPHDDPDISQFKTTDYPYAFPYIREEDSKGLHMHGILAVIAVIVNYLKAFFRASDWYAIMNTLIMPCFRQALSEVSYVEILGGKQGEDEEKEAKKELKKTINHRLWEAMNAPGEDGGLSVVKKLHKLYGIKVKSVELRSIDPPENWREITLSPYEAEQKKKAAKYQAEASAILFDDTNQALQAWLEGQRAAGHDPTQVQIEAKQEELRQRALAKTPGYQQVHIKGLEGATTAVVGGGGVGGTGILVGGSGGKNPRNPSGGGSGKGGKSPGGNPAKLGKTPEQQADEYFQQFKKYPKWDPLNRTPN